MAETNLLVGLANASVEDLTGELRERFWKVRLRSLCHVVACEDSYGSRYEAGVPIPYYAFLDAGCPVQRSFDVMEWFVNAGVLTFLPYVEGRCRIFKTTKAMRSELARVRSLDRGSDESHRLFDANAGKWVGRINGGAFYKTRTTYDGSHSWSQKSKLIHDVMGYWKNQRDVVNIVAMERKVDELEAEASRLKESGDQTASQKADARFRSARRAVEYVRRQDMRPAPEYGENVVSYVSAYEVQPVSGRLTQKRGGMQSALNELKQAAKKGIPGYTNWDVIASQTTILGQELQMAAEAGAEGVDPTVLDRYPGKDELASRYGIERSLWSVPEHAPKFLADLKYESVESARRSAMMRTIDDLEEYRGIEIGSYDAAWENRLPDHLQAEVNAWTENRIPAMASAAIEMAAHSPYTEEEAYRILRSVYADMIDSIQAYAGWLVTNWFDANKSRGMVRGPCDLPFRLSDYDSDAVRRKKALTMRLQGREAAFVHHLTLLSGDYDYIVLRNEHDGFPCIGDVPKEAIRRARNLSGFHNARLKNKPFV